MAMIWKILTTSIVSGWALLMLTQAGSAQTATTDTSRGLSIRYADGRTSTRPLKPKAGMMTAVFPRIDGAETARDGMLLNGLDVDHVVEGDDVVVTVSLRYRGGLERQTVKVATVRLAAGHPVEVDELRRYGVEPLTLSIVSIPPTYAFAPLGVSASAYVDVRATPVGPNAAAYRVTITNRAPFPLMWFRFEAHRSERGPISARPRGKRDFPLVLPNAEYTFELAVGSMGRSSGDDPGAWLPLDRIEVTSLMWQDGVVEGDKETAREQLAFDKQRAAHLRALLGMLRGSRSIAALRDAIARTRPQDVELKKVWDDLFAQLDRFAAQPLSSDGLDFKTWLGWTVIDQEQWLARIVFPKL
jgi:hypothetical protein